MALPGEADFARADADGNTDLDTYLQAATATAPQRARLIKLAMDAAVSGFAGRESLYEYFFFGDPVRMAGAQVSGYDREPARGRDAGPGAGHAREMGVLRHRGHGR
jgi:4-hydroxyphenylacetate 3-monooxygenase